jgi:hypothetical protein
MSIVIVSFAVYTLIDPPFNSLHLSVTLLAYYLFSFAMGLPLASRSWVLIMSLLGGSLIVSAIICFGVRPWFARRMGGYQSVRELIVRHKSVSSEVMDLNLRNLSNHRVWAIARALDCLDRNAINFLFSFLETNGPRTAMQGFFTFSMGCRISQLFADVPSKASSVVERFAERLKEKHSEFWAAVWRSDLRQILRIATEIGGDNLILEQMTEGARGGAIMTRQGRCWSSAASILLIVFVFAWSSFLLVGAYYSGHEAASLVRDMVAFRKVVSNLALSLGEIWCPEQSANFTAVFAAEWQTLKQNDSPAIKAVLAKDVNGSSFEQKLDDYAAEVFNALNASNFSGGLLSDSIFLVLEEAVENGSALASDKLNSLQGPLGRWLDLAFAIAGSAFLIGFVATVALRISQRHKLAKEFLRLPKSAVIRHAGLERSSLSVNHFAIRTPLHALECTQIKTSIRLLVLVVVVAASLFFADHWVHGIYREELSGLVHTFASYADADMSLLWISFANLLRFFGAPSMSAALRSDSHVDALYRSSYADSILQFFSPSLRLMIGATITRDDADDDLAAGQNAIQSLVYAIGEHASVHRTYSRLLLVRMIISLVDVVLGCAISFFSVRHLSWHVSAEDGELTVLWNDFISRNGSQLGELPRQIPFSSLPFVGMKVSHDGKFLFATSRAVERYALSNSTFFDLPFAPDCIAALDASMQNHPTKEIVLTLDWRDSTLLLYPIYHSDCTLSGVDFFFLLELPREAAARFDPHALFRFVFPAFVPPSLPQTRACREGPAALLSLKLLGFGAWSDAAPPDSVSFFLRELVAALDRAAAEFSFVRLQFSGAGAIFVNDSEAQQTQIVFFRICAQFGRQIMEAVEKISREIETGLQPSIVFWRASAVVCRAMCAKAAQSDIIGDGYWTASEIHDNYGLPGMAFSCPHKETNRFPNMVRAKTWQDMSGRHMDFFVVI